MMNGWSWGVRPSRGGPGDDRGPRSVAPRFPRHVRGSVSAGLAGLLLALAPGCRLIQTAADVPGQAVRAITPASRDAEAGNPVEMQQLLMRFADEFIARMTDGVELLRRGSAPLSESEYLRWKLAFGTAVCSIASGPNAAANLLDMTAYITQTRMALEAHWMPNVFGDSARPLLESCQASETEIWRISGKMLKPEQQEALREAVVSWQAQHSVPDRLPGIRAVGFAMEAVKTHRPGPAKPGSLLSVFLLDPLAGLDPARRELAATRLFAERALFVARVMPTLLRWQMELLSVSALDQPAVRQWTTNVTRVADSIDRLTLTAEQVPRQLATERQAILDALQKQSRELAPLLERTRETLTAGSQLATNLNTTLETFDAVLERLEVGEPDDPAKRRKEPFRIRDYSEAAARLEAAARQLTDMLQAFDATLGANSRAQLARQIEPLLQRAQAEGDTLLRTAFRYGLLLVGAILAAALVYRLIASRLTGQRPDVTGAGGGAGGGCS